jgi:hypothetical protein
LVQGGLEFGDWRSRDAVACAHLPDQQRWTLTNNVESYAFGGLLSQFAGDTKVHHIYFEPRSLLAQQRFEHGWIGVRRTGRAYAISRRRTYRHDPQSLAARGLISHKSKPAI